MWMPANTSTQSNLETSLRSYITGCFGIKHFEMYSAVVALIPLAKTHDMNEHIIVKDQYHQWLKVHPVFKTSGKVKDYSRTWETIIREISAKVKNSKNKLHKLILSLYCDAPPQRALDYTSLLINAPQDHKKIF